MNGLVASSAAFCLAVIGHYVLQMDIATTGLVCLGSFLLVSSLFARHFWKSLPPGPSGYPIIGNALQLPEVHPWLTYSKWADTYGNLVHLKVLSEHLIIINSSEVARDLLEKRSSVYSDRPHFTMAGDLSGFGEGLVLLPYGDEWRAQRKIVAQAFSQSTLPGYYRIQEHEARELVKNVMEDPGALVNQTKVRIAAIIMRVTYGYSVKGEDDPMITIPFTSMGNFSAATEPGKWMVDLIPQLKYLPEWTPGATFLRTARKWRQLEWDASWNPYLWCKRNLETGVAQTPSLCATMLSQSEGTMSSEDEATLVWAASAGLGGGLDTNMSTIFTFILAMLRYPHIQEKAQAEIDSVLGPDRLPTISDRAALPYVRSVIAETYRWVPAVPLGIPHALTRDDHYNGMFLPQGSLLIPNVWHMLHDPKTYDEPMEFKPERFANMDSEMKKITDLAFGFGRRACPGYQFAEGTIFAVISTLLATSNIVPARDAHGKQIITEIMYTSGTIIFPETISCDIQPRSVHAKALLSRGVLDS